MRNNAFIDILFNWEKMSKAKRVQRLQDLENMIARFQGRKPRTITTKYDPKFVKEHVSKDRNPEAFYSRNDRNRLYLLTLNMPAIDAIKNILHEGFHAYVDDFVSGRVSVLKLYSKLDSERFFIEEENLPAIYDEFEKNGRMLLFDSFYIEERSNYIENSIYMTKMIIDAIDNPVDAMSLQKHFIFALAFGVDNERRGHKLERKFGTTYESMVVNALNREDCEKEKIVKTGKIVNGIDSGYLEFFNKASLLYKEFVSVSDSPLMNLEAKRKAEQEVVDKISVLYSDYVLKVLKEKKKN